MTSHRYATQSWVTSQNYATEADLDARIDALVNGAPAAFDTLKEIADVLQGNVDSIGDILTALGNKVDKVDGKGLSSNDFTDALLTKLNGIEAGANKYVLPTATGSVLGGVKVGATLAIASGVLNMKAVGTAGTYTKVTVDVYGRVTGHASLAATDIPNLPWSKITSGKPTTLAGYGITDAYTKTEADGRYVNVSGDTMTGTLHIKPTTGNYTEGIRLYGTKKDGSWSNINFGCDPSATSGTHTNQWILGRNSSNHFVLDRGNSTGVSGFVVTTAGNMGIGTTSPSYKLHVVGGIYSSEYIQIGSGRIKWDSSNNALYVEKSDGTAIGFYSKRFISAKGANDDAGGSASGVTALSQLSDVTLGTLANGQALMWNGSKWTNKTIESGLDETALAQYLTDNGYATQGWATSQFAYKTGTNATGTWPISITGNAATATKLNSRGRLTALTGASMGEAGVNLYQVYNNGYPIVYGNLIHVRGMGAGELLLGWSGSDGGYAGLYYRNHRDNEYSATWSPWVTILDSSNYTSTLDSRYLRTVSLATISDLHSSWDAALKAQKPAWLTTVSLSTISDLNASWDALLKAAPSVYVTRWPTAAEVGALTQTSADSRYLLKSAYTAADVLAKLKTVDGSGSGLDADTLDGYHLSNIETGGWTSFTTHVYDATNGTRYYCYRIGNLNNAGDVILRVRVTTDINYPSYSEWTLRMAHNALYVPVVSLVPNTPCHNTLTVYVDDSDYLWIRSNALWSSSMQYKIERNIGSILITSNPSRAETTPSNVSYTISNFGSTRNGVANAAYTHYASTYNATTSVKIGSGIITWDATNNCFHFSHGLYSDSFVSAKGANSGSGGTVSGVTKLSDLSDVQLGTLATNQVLSWNGSKWVNKTLDMGLDEKALAQYLTNNQYLTMPTGDARYVNLTGDTMSGTLTISTADLGTQLIINRNNATSLPAITYKNTSGILGRIGVGGSGNGNAAGQPCFAPGTSTTLYPILTSNNYTSYIGNSFVKKAGDTMTGTLTVPSLVVSGSTATVSGNKVWHAGNDGSGSGLDADLLDGLQYTSFESYRVVQINASSLNQNTWYPVTMSIGNSLQTRIRIEGNTSANASWNPRADKYMSLILDYTVNGSQWGWTSAQRVIYQYMEGSGTSSCLRGLGQLTNSSTEYVFVRGGAVYNFYVSRFITPVIRTSTYTVREQSVSPTTTAPAAISRTNALITDNVYSATQLQTAHTINGTAFNGTSNIVTSYWGTARTLSLTGNATGSVSMNGSSNVSMSVNVNYATSAGNASTLGGTSKAGLFTALSSSNATNLSVTIGGTTKNITDLYANYAVSAGNADTLDGKHVGVSRSQVTQNFAFPSFGSFGSATDNASYYTNIEKWIQTNYSGKEAIFFGIGNPNSQGILIGHKYTNTGNSAGFPRYCSFLYSSLGGVVYTFGTSNYSQYAYQLARTVDNVASASKLQTARTLWGQSFNGTANVSGNMTGVGNITMSGNINGYTSITSAYGDGNRRTRIHTGGFEFLCATGGWATGLVIKTNDNASSLGYVAGAYGEGDSISNYYFYGGTYTSPKMVIQTGGNVGIGTTSPSYKLHVVGTGYFSGALTTASTITASSSINISQTSTSIGYKFGGNIILRWNGTSYNNTILSGTGGIMYFRPNGTASTSGEVTISTAGAINSPSTIFATTGIYSNGYVSAKGLNQSSDIRLKEKISDIRISAAAIANAPSFLFSWKKNGLRDVGSSAQYWKNVLPDAVKERDGWLEMAYGNIALISAISLARDFETLEQRVDRLEKENGKLKKKIKELERRTI